MTRGRITARERRLAFRHPRRPSQIRRLARQMLRRSLIPEIVTTFIDPDFLRILFG